MGKEPILILLERPKHNVFGPNIAILKSHIVFVREGGNVSCTGSGDHDCYQSEEWHTLELIGGRSVDVWVKWDVLMQKLCETLDQDW